MSEMMELKYKKGIFVMTLSIIIGLLVLDLMHLFNAG